MFYTANGLIETFEDIAITSQIPNNSQNIENIACNEECYNTGFIKANTTLPNNIIQFTKKYSIQTYNSSIVEPININTFRNTTVNIIMDLIFNFTYSFIGINKPFITNIFNINNRKKNKLIFKYYDQYEYEVNLQTDYLLDNTLYNIIYLPIQPKIDISTIDATKLNVYNIMNGSIITIANDIIISLLPNKIFEIYIYSLNDITLNIYYFENKNSQYTLNKNTYYYIYYNINTNDLIPITITILDIINMYIITTPIKVNLISDNNLLYYNNFLNYRNKYFYNTVSKSYDTQIISSCDTCNIKEYGSRKNKMSYYGSNSYIQLPELNLNYPFITFSINFNTINNKNQILFDIGRKINDVIGTSLFVNFEGNTVRFNHIENKIFNTFIYNKTNLIDGQWHNIIWTINNTNGEWTIIIDTVKTIYKSNNIINFKKLPNFNNNFIGNKNSITNKSSITFSKYEGFIDNFKIYNKELMSYEITNENIK